MSTPQDQALLGRIASALERIANSLEELPKREQVSWVKEEAKALKEKDQDLKELQDMLFTHEVHESLKLGKKTGTFVRLMACFRREDITSIKQVMELSSGRYLCMKNFGQKSLDYLRRALARRGLALKGEAWQRYA